MDATTLRRMVDPAEFRERVLIETDSGPRALGDCLRENPWQQADFEALDPAWRKIAGQDVDVTHWRGWLERPRGHSKSQDCSLMALWCLAFSTRRVTGVTYAVDREQAALIRSGIERLLFHNPWLQSVISVSQWKVVGTRTGSELAIGASDVASSWGLLIDWCLCDEVTAWPKDDLWVSMLSAVAKKKNALLVCAMNAGWCGTWPETTRKAIAADPGWYFSSLDGVCASWIDEARLEEQRRLLPATAYARLWSNRYSPTSGDAISPEDVEAVFARDLPPMHGDNCEDAYEFSGGLDLSVSRDFSSFVIVAKHEYSGRYRVARCWLWKPPAGGKVDQEEIEATIFEAHRAFGLRSIVADPFQAEYLISRLQKRGVQVEGRAQVGKNLVEQCMLLLEQVSSGNLESYRFAPLQRDLMRLRVEERSFGLRLVSDRLGGTHGHGDTCTALTLALVAAKGFEYHGGVWGGVISEDEVSGLSWGF